MDASLVALPREGLFFAAARGLGAGIARAGGAGFRKASPSVGGDRVLVSHNMPSAVSDYLAHQGFEPIPACGGAVAVAPLISGVRAGVRYAEGELGISIRGRIGVLISDEAGACVRGRGGEAFPMDLTTPASTLMVAGDDDDIALLLDALACAGLA